MAEQPRTMMLGEYLVMSGLVSQEDLDRALKEQPRHPNLGLGELLVELGLLREEHLLAALRETGQEVVDLRRFHVPPEAVAALPEPLARRFQVAPVKMEGETLVVASARPGTRLAADLTFALGRPVRVITAARSAIAEALDVLYRLTADLAAPLREGGGDQGVARTVELIIAQGIRSRASDIHLEPQGDHLRVRYRVDGVLHDATPLPGEQHNPIMARIKVLAGLNIVEKLQAQDGQIALKAEGQELDIRVNIMPTIKGEKAVLRLLTRQRLFTLEGLGMSPELLERYRSLTSRPYGMVVVAGPTGAGKTTTLYATIQEMDSTERNIITLEDPVEYAFPRITQIQVNPRAGITFASGLRASLRQDPDVIVVGEIRDGETAQIAVQAALTGHLVMTSLHATDALRSVYRLLDIGVEPYLLASALSGVVAQRLCRRTCSHCAAPAPLSGPEAAFLELQGISLEGQMAGSGCAYCNWTGFSGRVGIYSVLRVSEEARRLIARAAPVTELEPAVRADGYKSLLDAGLGLVKAGTTTVSELMRVIGAET